MDTFLATQQRFEETVTCSIYNMQHVINVAEENEEPQFLPLSHAVKRPQRH